MKVNLNDYFRTTNRCQVCGKPSIQDCSYLCADHFIGSHDCNGVKRPYPEILCSNCPPKTMTTHSNIRVQNAKILDEISVLCVKWLKFTDEKQSAVLEELSDLEGQLVENIGYENLKLIKESAEFSRLYEANLKIFEITEDAKHKYISFEVPIFFNKARFKAKQEIQTKFFGDKLIETKN